MSLSSISTTTLKFRTFCRLVVGGNIILSNGIQVVEPAKTVCWSLDQMDLMMDLMMAIIAIGSRVSNVSFQLQMCIIFRVTNSSHCFVNPKNRIFCTTFISALNLLRMTFNPEIV